MEKPGAAVAVAVAVAALDATMLLLQMPLWLDFVGCWPLTDDASLTCANANRQFAGGHDDRANPGVRQPVAAAVGREPRPTAGRNVCHECRNAGSGWHHS